jgi:thioesterase domain-containing protein
MMVDMEHMTGVKMPLAVLFTNPTIRALSKLFDAPPQDEMWKPIVEIKATGKRNPIFFAHGISGNVFKYHALAHLLDEDQPSYGLQAAGLDGKEKPIDVMEDIAAHHIREIIKFQPEGPYALAGGSFGGYMAYEIACQLRALGKEVNFLCLFDLEAADELQFMPTGVKQIKTATLFAERFLKRAMQFISSDKEERKRYLAAKMNDRKGENQEADLESWLDKHKMVELIGEESAAYFRNVEDACYRAMMNYKIKHYDRDITLVRAKEGYFNNTYAPDLGWSHFTKGKVEVHIVPGDHNSIFWDPNVYELARCCNSTLDRVFSKSSVNS